MDDKNPSTPLEEPIDAKSENNSQQPVTSLEGRPENQKTAQPRHNYKKIKQNIFVVIGILILGWYLNYFNVLVGTIKCGNLPVIINHLAGTSYTKPTNLNYWLPNFLGPEDYECHMGDNMPGPGRKYVTPVSVKASSVYHFKTFTFADIQNKIIRNEPVSEQQINNENVAVSTIKVFKTYGDSTPIGTIKIVQGSQKQESVCADISLCTSVGKTSSNWVVYRNNTVIDQPTWAVLTEESYINILPNFNSKTFVLTNEMIIGLLNGATPNDL